MTLVTHSRVLLGCLSLVVLLAVNAGQASEVEALFIKGNEHYQTGDFQSAIDQYQKIVELGFETWEVFYNLGNAYYKEGKIAEAILNFERAKKIRPDNEDLAFNLELANLSVVDRIPVLPKFFLLKWIESGAKVVSVQVLAALALASYWLLIAFVAVRLFLKSHRPRRMLSGIIVVCCITLVVFSGLFLVRVYENETLVEAVVMVDKVDVLSAPGDSGTEVFTLHAGVKVQVQDHSGAWAKIRLTDGKLGWLRNEIIETI